MSRSHAEAEFGLDAGAFPFESRFADIGGARLHYIDEGAGPILLMLQGNPSWGVVFRDLVTALRQKFRCVVPDLAGFGLSRPPPGFSYLPSDHAPVIAGLIRTLDLSDATLVAHDWGGPIGLAAARETGAVSRLFLGNTWAWPVNGDWHFEWFSRLLGGRLGGVLAERYAVFVNVVTPNAMRRRKPTQEEMAALRAPFDRRQDRRAMQVFPRAILGERDWLAGLQAYVATFSGPAHLFWPDGDIAFRDKELSHWRGLLPQAGVTRATRCGHFPWMEAPEEAARALMDFAAR